MANRYFIAAAIVLYVLIGSVLSSSSSSSSSSESEDECKEKCEGCRLGHASEYNPFNKEACVKECNNLEDLADFSCASAEQPPQLSAEHQIAVESLFRVYEETLAMACIEINQGNLNEALDAIMGLYEVEANSCLYLIYPQPPGVGCKELRSKYEDWLKANCDDVDTFKFTVKGGSEVAGDTNGKRIYSVGDFTGTKGRATVFEIAYMKVMEYNSNDELKMSIDMIGE